MADSDFFYVCNEIFERLNDNIHIWLKIKNYAIIFILCV